MQKISGKEISQNIIKRLKELGPPTKIMAAILIGENSASLSFLRQKEKVAEELGVDFRLYKLSDKLTNDDLRREMGRISKQGRVGGVIVQLPLPPAVNKYYVLNAIPREKDVDVLGERALGAFYNDRNEVMPPAIGVVVEFLGIMNYELGIMKVIVIGSGFLVGKPIVTWLQNKAAEITVFNEYTKNLKSKLKDADIIISGVGKPNLFCINDVKENSLIIDFGYSVDEAGKVCGDFNPIIHNSKFIIHYTPTPGGTGPVLVAKLFENFYTLNKKK